MSDETKSDVELALRRVADGWHMAKRDAPMYDALALAAEVVDLRPRLAAAEAATEQMRMERDSFKRTATRFADAQELTSVRAEKADARLAATTGEVARLRTALGRIAELGLAHNWFGATPAEDASSIATAALAHPAVVTPPQPMKEPTR